MLEKGHMYNNPIGGFGMYGITQHINNPEDVAGTILAGWFGNDGGTLGFTTTAVKNEQLGGATFAVGANSCGFNLDIFGFLDPYTIEIKSRQAMSFETIPTMAPASSSTMTPEATSTMSPGAVPTAEAAKTMSSTGVCHVSYVLPVAIGIGCYLGRSVLI
jgi:hypothetical protein